MRRGEVRWYVCKAPDKKRPVLILTRDSILDVLGEVTVAPITSTIRQIPTEVILGPEEGMPQTATPPLRSNLGKGGCKARGAGSKPRYFRDHDDGLGDLGDLTLM
jgi:hypothetical protein